MEQQVKPAVGVKALTDSTISPKLNTLIQAKNKASLQQSSDPLSKLGGTLAIHCQADLSNRRVTEVASMATLFRGYEALLPGKELHQVGRVSSTASGICGGVHATASALCLEMALGLKPPPLGIVLRNLLLSCQYLNDNTMHLFVLAGPDYSQQIVEKTNPEIWQKAITSPCKNKGVHGYQTLADLMVDLNKGTGKLYKEALQMVSIARQSYICLGGKYPHSESIIPGGVSLDIDPHRLLEFKKIIQPFANYSVKTAAIWDDVFDFFYAVNPMYVELGKSPASMLDFGQWDHPEHYDATYKHCDEWGAKRWSTPAVVVDGVLKSSKLSQLNAGMEESLNHSYQCMAPVQHEQLITEDPLGNAISPSHPWNKRTTKPKKLNPNAYSWGSSLTWCGHGFEVGAYSRLYLTAVAQKLPASQYLASTGKSLDFEFPNEEQQSSVQWEVPEVWNAFERNRARAYALAFNYSVTLENIDIALRLLSEGESQTHVVLDSGYQEQEQGLGVGLWGASRGFLAHWAVIKEQAIDNYQISIPSRVNIGTRTVNQELGPLEKALVDTPILESQFTSSDDFYGIDIQRTIQSFDPCMSCTAHILFDGSDEVKDKVIDTSFPV